MSELIHVSNMQIMICLRIKFLFRVRRPSLPPKDKMINMYWLLRFPDLSAIYSHCDAVLGVILDQPRSHQCQGGSRSVIALCKHCVLCSLYSWLLSSLSLSLRPGLGCGYPDKSAGWLLLLRSDPRVVVTMFASFVWPGPPGVWLETMNGPCLQWPGLTAGHQTGKMIKQTLTQPPPPPPFLFWISELL